MILRASTVFCEDAVFYADTYGTAMSLCHAAAVEGWAHVHYVFFVMTTCGEGATH